MNEQKLQMNMDSIERPTSAATISSRASSRASQRSGRGRGIVSQNPMMPTPTLTPSQGRIFECCASTASFFIFAQRNVILSLHHDTLAIERRFTGHVDDVIWIEADNLSERGAGRLVASYDNSMMTIVWDLLNGQELARLEPYGDIRVASWMKNGRIAFGNSQGNITLFDPYTTENMTIRSIYDPITALAPASDCKTFAIGYLNGTILIANIERTFSVLHTLNTQRAPSPINCLGWHGSSSKQKSDMLASQTMDGDLRVWSIPKVPGGGPPAVIRNFQQGGYDKLSGPCWFSWSKMGRIVQYMDGLTYVWDVRTKRVTYESVPTIEGIVGISSYGPQAVLFTVGRNHTVQQYDLNPAGAPTLVRNVQHVPGAIPPSPPFSDLERRKGSIGGSSRQQPQLPIDIISSEGEGDSYLSPLQRIAHDVDSRDDSDVVAPPSPGSSRSSNVSSKGDLPRLGRRTPQYPSRYERSHSTRLRPQSPAIISGLKTPSTVFSSASSTTSSRRPGSSRLRQEVMRVLEDKANLDLFPHIKASLGTVPFRPPTYPDGRRTPDMLRLQMLRCVFGWQGDIDTLIRWELRNHKSGSAAFNILSKWLGDVGPDTANMIGSESMTSSDWMLLALNTVDKDSQKKVGDAFVQRLLEKGEVHPAVAILLGLGENQEAIEIYVSRGDLLEAVLLTCLLFPNDWQRISHLVRMWGENAVSKKDKIDADLAVRCFACAAAESTEPWFSPAAKDAAYMAQMQYMGPEVNPSSPMSSVSATSPGGTRRPQFAALQPLITNFSNTIGSGPHTAMDDRTPMIGMTPLDGEAPLSALGRQSREPMSSMTATPGGFTSRRMQSRDRAGELPTPLTKSAVTAMPSSALRVKQDEQLLAYQDRGRGAIKIGEPLSNVAEHLPSPAVDAFSSGNKPARLRNGSRARKPDDLMLNTSELVRVDPSLASSATTTTQASSVRIRPIDDYVNSLNEARVQSRRPDSRATDRGVSRARAASESRQVRYVRPSRQSPSSPISMSPDDPALKVERIVRARESGADVEKFYRVASPVDSNISRPRRESLSGRTSSRAGVRRTESVDRQGRPPSRTTSRNRGRGSRNSSPDRERRGRSRAQGESASLQLDDSQLYANDPRIREQSIGARVRSRNASANRLATSPDRSERQRSQSARPEGRAESPPRRRQMSRSRMPRLQTNFDGQPGQVRRLAQQELELRRQSLAKKTSTSIVQPDEYKGYPRTGPEQDIIARAQTADPELIRMTRTRESIGLPANPGAIRHMSQYEDDIPAVPQISEFHRQSQQTGETLTLPAVAFEPPSRVGSAPPEKARNDSSGNLQIRPTVHGRMNSITGVMLSNGMGSPTPPPPPPPPPPPIVAAPMENSAVLGSEVLIVAETDMSQGEPSPAVLPELQHLANSQPSQSSRHTRKDSIGVINIAIDDTPSPGMEHALANHSSSNSLSSKFRRTRDQSTSRAPNPVYGARSPYESIPDPKLESFRVGSAPPGAMLPDAMPMNTVWSNEEKPSFGGFTLPAVAYVPPERPQTTAPQNNGMPSTMTGYRNPKEIARAMASSMAAPVPPPNSSVAAYTHPKTIRANMPPSSTQAGATPYNMF